MALSDPQTVTVNAVANSLMRTGMGTSSGTFAKDDGSLKLKVSHTPSGKRNRHLIRLDHEKVITDPLVTAQNLRVGMSAYVVIDVPAAGYTVAEAKQIVDGLTAYLTASSGSVITKTLGNEV